MGVEPTTLAAKDRINGFEGHEGHRTPFASVPTMKSEAGAAPDYISTLTRLVTSPYTRPVECGGLPAAEAGLPPLHCDRVRRKPADEASHAHQTTGSKHALCRRARSPDESTGIRSHSRATPHDASRQSGVVEARGLIPANKSCRETPSYALSHPQHVVASELRANSNSPQGFACIRARFVR